MKKNIFLFIGNCLIQSVLAQSSLAPAQVLWSKESKAPSGTEVLKTFSATDSMGGFFAVRTQTESLLNSGSTFYLEYYDEKMQLLREKELDMKVEGKKRNFRDVVQMAGGQVFLLSSFLNKKNEIAYLFAQKIDTKKLILEKNIQKVAQIIAAESADEFKFAYNTSKDSSKIVFFTPLKIEKSTEPSRCQIEVFDNQMKELWSKDFKLPYAADKLNIEEYQVDNQGNVYLLGVVNDVGRAAKKAGKPSYHYVVFSYSDSGELLHEYKIEAENKFISDLTFRLSDNGQITVTGFYSEKGDGGVHGVCFQRINPVTHELIVQKNSPFDFQFRADYLTARQKEKAQKAEQSGDVQAQPELYRFLLQNLVLRNDGGALLVGEQYFMQERTYRRYNGIGFSNSTYQTDYYYNYNDILVANIRPTGELEWATRIPKYQVTVNDKGEFSSYAMAILRDKICFLFNDNAKNFVPKQQKLFPFSGDGDSVVTLAELKKDGSLQMFPLFNNADNNVLTRPRLCRQNGRKNMLIFGEHGRKYKFGILMFL